LKEIYETLEIKKERTVMKRIRKLTTAFLVIALLVTSLVSVPAFADEPEAVIPDIVRIAGDNRYLTAIEVSKEVYPTDETNKTTGAEAVIIASGEEDHWADALAGSALAALKTAPILLAKKDMIHAETLAEIARLFNKSAKSEVYILGGKEAIGAGVAATLVDAGYTVKRIAGDNRYETAALIAEVVGAGEETAPAYFLATGEDYADALAIGPVAYDLEVPVLLTKKAALPDATKALLEKNDSVVILGGPAAVSMAVQGAVKTITGLNPGRVFGENRFETATEIAKKYFSSATPSATTVVIAQGRNFPDALVGGYLGGVKGAPILLVAKDLDEDVADYIEAQQYELAYILGGTSAVSKATEGEVEAALLGLGFSGVSNYIEFFKGAAADETVTVTNANTGYNGDKKIVLPLKATDYTVDELNVTLLATYLNTLAVGEHTVPVTLDGYAVGDIVITVLDETKATLSASITNDDGPLENGFAYGVAEDVVVDLEGYSPTANPTDKIDLTGVAVKLNGAALGTDRFTAEYKKITICAAYVKTLPVGSYEVSVTLKDGRSAEATFVVVGADALVAGFGANATVLEFTYETLSVDDLYETDTNPIIHIIGDGAPDLTDAAKLALLKVKVDGKALTNADITGAYKSFSFKDTFLKTLTVGEHEIVVEYDGEVLGTMTLNVTLGDIYAETSSIKGVTVPPGIVLDSIYTITVELKDKNKNVIANTKFELQLTGDGAKGLLASVPSMASAKSADADGVGVEFTTDANGKATVYLRVTKVSELHATALKVLRTDLSLLLNEYEGE